MSHADIGQFPGGDLGKQQEPSEAPTDSTEDERTPEEVQQDKELAERLSALIEDANSRVVPLTKMIRKVCYFLRMTPTQG